MGDWPVGEFRSTTSKRYLINWMAGRKDSRWIPLMYNSSGWRLVVSLFMFGWIDLLWSHDAYYTKSHQTLEQLTQNHSRHYIRDLSSGHSDAGDIPGTHQSTALSLPQLNSSRLQPSHPSPQTPKRNNELWHHAAAVGRLTWMNENGSFSNRICPHQIEVGGWNGRDPSTLFYPFRLIRRDTTLLGRFRERYLLTVLMECERRIYQTIISHVPVSWREVIRSLVWSHPVRTISPLDHMSSGRSISAVISE